MGNWISQTRPGLDVLGSKPIDVRLLVTWLIDNEMSFTASAIGIRSAVRIEAALKACEGEEHLFIEQDNDYELVKQAAERPMNQRGQPLGYPCSNSRKLLPYIDDIANAVKKKPKEQAKKPAAAAAE